MKFSNPLAIYVPVSDVTIGYPLKKAGEMSEINISINKNESFKLTFENNEFII